MLCFKLADGSVAKLVSACLRVLRRAKVTKGYERLAEGHTFRRPASPWKPRGTINFVNFPSGESNSLAPWIATPRA